MIIDFTVKGVRVIDATRPMTIIDEHGDRYRVPPQASVVQVSPSQWPPKPGDLWRDDDGDLWFAVAGSHRATNDATAQWDPGRFAAILADLQVKTGMDDSAMAALAGNSRSMVNRWRNQSEHKPGFDPVSRLVSALSTRSPELEAQASALLAAAGYALHPISAQPDVALLSASGKFASGHAAEGPEAVLREFGLTLVRREAAEGQ